MNRFVSPRFLFAVTVATAALGAATAAVAHPGVSLSIGFQGGPAWVEQAPEYAQPWPVYAQPQPFYEQPAPVYVRPPVFAAPRVVFERPRWGGGDARYEWEREHAWRHAERHYRDRHEDARGGSRDDGDHRHGRRD